MPLGSNNTGSFFVTDRWLVDLLLRCFMGYKHTGVGDRVAVFRDAMSIGTIGNGDVVKGFDEVVSPSSKALTTVWVPSLLPKKWLF